MKEKSLNIVTLQLDNLKPYEKNREKIIQYLKKYKEKDLIIAPEVCLTDYDYENLEEACQFGKESEEIFCKMVDSSIFIFTKLTKRDGDYINEAIVIHKNQVIHRQAKHKLFALGDEDKYLKAGSEDEIKPFEIDGIKYGILICFELRFKELWKRLEGCDVILVPAQWGLPRKRHLEILSSALAVVNQSYLIVSNSSREDMARSSGVYSPDGGVVREDFSLTIESKIDLNIVKIIRRYFGIYR